MPARRKEEKNNFPKDIFQKAGAPEKKMKNIEVYSEALQAEKEPAPLARDQKKEKDLEKLLLLVKEAIKRELIPLQHSMEGLSKRISTLEKQVSFYEKWLGDFLSMYDQQIEKKRTKEKTKRDQETPDIYQDIKVTLFVDKYEQVNNLGNLGIKDLSGQLNIGTTYENSSNPSQDLSQWTEKADQFNQAMEKLKDISRQENGNVKSEQHERK